MAARNEGAIAGNRRYRDDGADCHTERRGDERRSDESYGVRYGDDVVARGRRGLCSLDLALLGMYRFRSVARTRPVQPERAGENEVRLRRGSVDGHNDAARAFDDAVAFRRILSDLVAAGHHGIGFYRSGAWRAFPQTWKAGFRRAAGRHGHSAAAFAGDRLLGGRIRSRSLLFRLAVTGRVVLRSAVGDAALNYIRNPGGVRR